MKKGCIIALVALALILIPISTWFIRSSTPKFYQQATVNLIREAEDAAAKHAVDHGAIPEETSFEDAVEIIRGNNPDERDYFEGRLDGHVMHGEIVDAWRNPMQMQRDPKGQLRFISAGENGEFGDGDDLTSEGPKGPKLPKPSG